MLESLRAWFYGSLKEAIRNDDPNAVLYFIHTKNENVNQYDSYGHTPIFFSLISHHYSCTIVLLEKGADPNLWIHEEKIKEPILQTYTRNYTHLSVLRLLVSYGANIQRIFFKEQRAKQYAIELEKRTRERNRLLEKIEQLLASNDGNPDERAILSAIEGYRTIGNYWNDLFEQERDDKRCNDVFRDHYESKAKTYYQKVEELRAKLHRMPDDAMLMDSPTKTPFTHFVDEGTTGSCGMRHRKAQTGTSTSVELQTFREIPT